MTIRRRRVLACAVSIPAAAVPAAAASAEPVHLTARDRARVHVAVPSHLRGQTLDVRVDGRPRTFVRHSSTFSVKGLAQRAARWHHVHVRGRRDAASARFAVGVRHGRRSPTLVLSSAPARSTASTRASFRYSTSRGQVSCTLDGRSVPCTRHTATVTAAPGRHVFVVRADVGRSSARLSWAWSVKGFVATAPSADPGPVATPAPAPPSPASPSPVAPSGGTAAEGSTSAPAGWRLLLSDTFDGNRLNTSLWRVYGPNWPGHAGNGLRDNSAVSVGDGMLTITAQMVGGTLVSGAISSRVSTTYGRVEFRARVDADPSQVTSGVVLMWPDSDNWPIDGETDIFESGTSASRGSFTSAVHYGASNQQVFFTHNASASTWRQMAMEWTPTSIRFYRDGALEGEVTDPAAISRASQHLCVQLDAFGPSMTGAVRLQVDDVRLYGLG